MPENTLLGIPTTDGPALNSLMDFYDPSDTFSPPINPLAGLINSAPLLAPANTLDPPAGLINSAPLVVPANTLNPPAGLINSAPLVVPANTLNPPAGLINNQRTRLADGRFVQCQ